MIQARASIRALFLAAALFVGADLVAAAPPRETQQPREVNSLREQIAALSGTVRPDDARRAAACAVETSRELARSYRVTGPAQFHNFLVNVGIKKRGLCHHWTRDLIQRLHALKLTSLDLHWGTARAGTLREHNAVVVTAKRQPFASGIVLDPWRRSGRLFAGPVGGDRYPWKEELSECFCRRGGRDATRRSDAATTNSVILSEAKNL